jgi:hypothetical protein
MGVVEGAPFSNENGGYSSLSNPAYAYTRHVHLE